MKKTLFILTLALLAISLFVGCTFDIASGYYTEEYNEDLRKDYVLKSEYVAITDQQGEITDEYNDWLKDLGIEISAVEEIIFSNTTPEKFNSSTGLDITKKASGKVLAYYDSTDKELWIVGEYIIANPDCRLLFNEFTSLSSIKNIELFDVSEVTKSAGMFSDECTVFDEINISNGSLIDSRPISATGNTVGTKVGEASAIFLGNLLVHGDNFIATAAKNGGIKKISTVDERTYICDSYLIVTTIVTGE